MLAQITVRTEQLDALLEDLEMLDPQNHTRRTDPSLNITYSNVIATFRAWKEAIQPPKERYHKPTCLDMVTDSLGGKA
jgi:hypothetical protein